MMAQRSQFAIVCLEPAMLFQEEWQSMFVASARLQPCTYNST